MVAEEKREEVIAVEHDIRAMIERYERDAGGIEAEGKLALADRMALKGDRARLFRLFRLWSELTGIPVEFDDLLDEEGPTIGSDQSVAARGVAMSDQFIGGAGPRPRD